MKLIRNALQTPDGTIIESKHRHDCRFYTDANGKEYMVDGGLEYLRRSVHADQIDMNLYDTESHQVQAKVLTWGSYGIRGDQPRRDIPIAEMETSHIKAVLRQCNPTPVLRNCMVSELETRYDNLQHKHDGAVAHPLVC